MWWCSRAAAAAARRGGRPPRGGALRLSVVDTSSWRLSVLHALRLMVGGPCTALEQIPFSALRFIPSTLIVTKGPSGLRDREYEDDTTLEISGKDLFSDGHGVQSASDRGLPGYIARLDICPMLQTLSHSSAVIRSL